MGGCICCRKESDDQESEMSKSGANYAKERLSIEYGEVNIQVRNTSISEVEAQIYVCATTDRLVIGNNPIIKKNRIEIDQNEHHNSVNGSIFVKDLKPGQKIVFLVLPLWKGGAHNEKMIFEEAVQNLLGLLEKSENCESIVLDEVGALRFGYPRQIIIEVLIRLFQGFLKSCQNIALRNITFVSHEMCTVNIFEKELKKYKNSLSN